MEAEAAPACSSQASSLPEALVIDEHLALNDMLKESHNVSRVRPAELNTGRTQFIAHDVKNGKYNMIWATTQSRRLIRKKEWSSHLAYLSRLLITAAAG